MSFSRSRFLATVALAWALVLYPLPAHETWAERVILIHYGYLGGDKVDAYTPDQVHDLAAIARDGSVLPVTALPVGGASVAIRHAGDQDPAAVFYRLQLGHWTISGSGDAEQWTEATAEAAAQAERSWTGSYSVTSIFAWNAALSQPRGGSIELLPLIDPATVAIGAPLPLRVYRNGEPLAGFTIEAEEEGTATIVSAADGTLAVPLQAGHQVILGNIDVVSDGHTVGHMAVLSFRR